VIPEYERRHDRLTNLAREERFGMNGYHLKSLSNKSGSRETQGFVYEIGKESRISITGYIHQFRNPGRLRFDIGYVARMNELLSVHIEHVYFSKKDRSFSPNTFLLNIFPFLKFSRLPLSKSENHKQYTLWAASLTC